MSSRDKKNRFQDILVLLSLLVLATILILGFVPNENLEETSINIFFFNIIMMIPVIIAMYFIIVSFRRRISRDLYHLSTTIRTKLMLSLLFAAILPTLPITLISNNIINGALSEMFNKGTQETLSNALDMSHQMIDVQVATIRKAADIYGDAVKAGFIRPEVRDYDKNIDDILGNIHVSYKIFDADKINNSPVLKDVRNSGNDLFINEFVQLINYDKLKEVYRIKNDDETYIISVERYGPYIAVFYKILPRWVLKQELEFEKTMVRYEQQIFLMPRVQDAVGMALLILSFFIIIMSVGLSYFLAQSITRPLYKLIDASRSIASGDFNIRLNRGASDEVTLLFNSFNEMALKLGESRKIMMHNQRLEVWKEVGSKLFHEIKNPLTPIRLSAERIQRKYLEKPDNLDSIISSGTETIIEEVDMLKHILGEFSKYTRMPDLKREYNDINQIIQNSVNAFQGHEEVSFELSLSPDIPDLYIDRILVRQMMNNLIKNAIEAMDGKGIVFIRSIPEDSVAAIYIADTGPGIHKNDINHLFEASFSRKTNGTGLGLAIVERTVVKHGGTIECKSAPGHGAEFIIRFPLGGEDN